VRSCHQPALMMGGGDQGCRRVGVGGWVGGWALMMKCSCSSHQEMLAVCLQDDPGSCAMGCWHECSRASLQPCWHASCSRGLLYALPIMAQCCPTLRSTQPVRFFSSGTMRAPLQMFHSPRRLTLFTAAVGAAPAVLRCRPTDVLQWA